MCMLFLGGLSSLFSLRSLVCFLMQFHFRTGVIKIVSRGVVQRTVTLMRRTFCLYLVVFCNWVFLLDRCTVVVDTSLSGRVIKRETKTLDLGLRDVRRTCVTQYGSPSSPFCGVMCQARFIDVKPR